MTFLAYLLFFQGLSTIFLSSQCIFSHVSLRASAIILCKASRTANYAGPGRAANWIWSPSEEQSTPEGRHGKA